MSGPVQVCVVGAGAAGMMAAIAAAQAGAKVTLLEKNAKPGRKLLLTGSGRCNLTHQDDALWTRYHAADERALAACCETVRRALDVEAALAFFRRLGLLTTARDGYVYPLSNTAQSVLFVLERELERCGVKRKYAQSIKALRRDAADGMWQVCTDGYAYQADRVILSTGSKACPETGSDGAGYGIAAALGHTIVPVLPSLCGVRVAFPGLSDCAGSRCYARVTLTDCETGEQVSDTGQVQWTRDGVSGIVVFQLSGCAAQWAAKGHALTLTFNLASDCGDEELHAFLEEQVQRLAGSDRAEGTAFVREVLRGLLPDRLADALGGQIAEQAMQRASSIRGLEAGIRGFTLPVTGVRGFAQAQVCRGGVSLSEIDPETFESKIAPGLYLAGEILDADGPCGGYNLQWAWSSGYVAGRSAAHTAVMPEA